VRGIVIRDQSAAGVDIESRLILGSNSEFKRLDVKRRFIEEQIVVFLREIEAGQWLLRSSDFDASS